MGEFESAAQKLPPGPGAGGGNVGDLAGTGGADGFGGFGRTFLTDGVGRGQTNRPEDVHMASSFLNANGFLAAPTREATEEFHRGIETAQTNLNTMSGGGLRVDGYAKPWGPTELLSQRAVTSGKMAAPNSAGTGEDGVTPAGAPDSSERGGKPTSAPGDAQAPAEGVDSNEHLRAMLDSASRNRRAAVERAARKEAEFSSAKQDAISAWERIKAEGAKLGIQVGISILTKRGRPASAGLGSAIEAHNQAKERAIRFQEEMESLRRDVTDWDAEIRDILSRMGQRKPTS